MRKPMFSAVRQTILRAPLPLDRPFWRAYGVAGILLQYYLGAHWLDKHVMPTEASPNFLRTGPTSPAEEELHMSRLIDLAELLYNLNDVKGFDAYIRDLRKRDDIEAKNSELLVAKLLRVGGIPFRFVTPTYQPRENYDLEIRLADNTWATCEMKCKTEGTHLSLNTLQSSLSTLERQLPENRANIVFVQIPQHWVTKTQAMAEQPEQLTIDPTLHKLISTATAELFRDSPLVLSVVFFADVLISCPDAHLRLVVRVDERVNALSPFAPRYQKGLSSLESHFLELPNWESLYDLVSAERMKEAAMEMPIT